MISKELEAADHLCEMITHVWLTTKDKMTYKTAIKCLRNYDKTYQQGRADAIKETLSFLHKYDILDCEGCQYSCFHNMDECITHISSQLKEQSNG